MTLPPFLEKYKNLLAKRSRGSAANPSRDWLILLGLILVLLVASIGWNVWFFSGVLSGENSATPQTGEVKADTGVLEQAEAAFEVRKQEEERYRSEYRFVDPSR